VQASPTASSVEHVIGPSARMTVHGATGSSLAVAKAMEYIDANLCEPLQLSAIAAVACMSRCHFARLFRHQVGVSPMEYQRLRRIDRARHLLRKDGRRIGQIATDLGFYDQSHFVRWFRRTLGCTPTAYARAAHPLVCEAADRAS
jgi:AraC family transcriptional regulator